MERQYKYWVFNFGLEVFLIVFHQEVIIDGGQVGEALVLIEELLVVLQVVPKD